jgi:hypothetical protein
MEGIIMLWQLHHQYPDGHTEFVAQRDGLGSDENLRAWVEEAQKAHPLPEGATWLMCNEEAGEFVRQGKEGG